MRPVTVPRQQFTNWLAELPNRGDCHFDKVMWITLRREQIKPLEAWGHNFSFTDVLDPHIQHQLFVHDLHNRRVLVVCDNCSLAALTSLPLIITDRPRNNRTVVVALDDKADVPELCDSFEFLWLSNE